MIYIVEDDSSIRELLVYTLNNVGFKADGFSKPSDFFRAMEMDMPELVLLDIMLPEEDGLSVLAKLRQKSSTAALPVIMLTAKDTEYDKVVGLDAGADDYIPKPFGMMELISRVRALLRRSNREKKEYRVRNLYVRPDAHVVKVGGDDVSLTLKEFELLCCLLEQRGTVLSRDALLNSVWGYGYDGENRTVDVHIRTLRQKLGEAGGVIETVRGVGYKIED